MIETLSTKQTPTPLKDPQHQQQLPSRQVAACQISNVQVNTLGQKQQQQQPSSRSKTNTMECNHGSLGCEQTASVLIDER